MASTADMADLADRFDVSGPAHIMSRSTADYPSATIIDWLRNISGSITETILSRATADHPSATTIDWDNEEDRRCIAACAVQGTCTLENDRTRCRMHTDALAPPWWESFNFHLMEVLQDEADNMGNKSIFGAIFEQVPLAEEPRHPSAPHYIVAFRGTMSYHPKIIQDIPLDLKVIATKIPSSKRSKRAHQVVNTLLATIAKGKAGGTIWLMGHSLGASLALDVGRTLMSDQGLNLPTFLFNPPQVCVGTAVDLLLPSAMVRRELQVASNLVKAGLGLFLSPHRTRMEALFERLSSWAPNLYVHDKDLICQGFINYFEQRQQMQMQERFSGGVAKSATTLSYSDMLFSVLGKEKEKAHLLPSATLWKNSTMGKDVQGFQQTSLAAHELQQWWKPDAELGLTNRRYSFP